MITWIKYIYLKYFFSLTPLTSSIEMILINFINRFLEVFSKTSIWGKN
jgi:hypothetical protein